MAKTLRVVVPPHPLIAHWLTVLRHQGTPAPLCRTAMEELGRWLTYEALRDWLPHRRDTVQTPLASTEGTVIEAGFPCSRCRSFRGDCIFGKEHGRCFPALSSALEGFLKQLKPRPVLCC